MGRMWRRAKPTALLGLIALVIVVVLQNTETVKTRLAFIDVSMPRALLLAVCLLT